MVVFTRKHGKRAWIKHPDYPEFWIVIMVSMRQRRPRVIVWASGGDLKVTQVQEDGWPHKSTVVCFPDGEEIYIRIKYSPSHHAKVFVQAHQKIKVWREELVRPEWRDGYEGR